MCGICGIATTEQTPSESIIRKMCATIIHRGPDGQGIYTSEGIGLGMRRLAVIDLSTGDQPMANESGDIQVVFNGEIYNFQELRKSLKKKGHRFKTNCDTEIIPHLYEEYDIDFIHKLNGMFAIALWDKTKKRLLLTRDRIGIKPLFYSIKENNLFFGSEIKCILAANGSFRTLDLDGLDQLLTFEYTGSPKTLIRDVYKLEPGHWLIWQNGKISKDYYWRISDVTSDGMFLSDEQWAEHLKFSLDRAVKRQMVSDVPLGCFLSGGIDSSIISCAMKSGSDRPPKTFSIGFEDQSYNELRYARLMAAHLQTDHNEAILNPDYLSLVDKLIYHMDQPIGDFSIFPTYLVSKIARDKVTVVLSGDGGDELFAGYDTYVADRLSRWTIDRLPEKVRSDLSKIAKYIPIKTEKKGLFNKLRFFLECSGLPLNWQHMRWMIFLNESMKHGLYKSDVYNAISETTDQTIRNYLDSDIKDPLRAQTNCDAQFYLSENILPKIDLMSMATSLETRVPYLDNEIIALSCNIPSVLKWKGLERKYILKKAYRNELAPEILRRKKEGFSIPLKKWLQMEWNALMHDLLSENSIKQDNIFNPATINRLMMEHESNLANHSHILWSLMVFQLWKNKFLN